MNDQSPSDTRTSTSEEWPRIFTPKTLGKRWHCSERHIRNLVERGDLRAFRLGGKLLRIKVIDVQEFEEKGGTSEA